MKKLDRLIVKTFFPPFVLTFFIALFVLLMQFLWKYVDDLIGKGLEWYIVSELMFYASASMVPMALPLAVLLSSIMTYGTLGEHYELFAIKASGISLMRAMRPMFITALLISIGAFLFSNFYLPYANLKFGTLLFDIREKRPALNISEGVFYNGIKGYTIRVERKGPNNQKIYDVMIYDHTDGQPNTNLLLADAGEMYMTKNKQYLVLRLFDGMQYQELKDNKGKKKQETLQTKFKEWEKIFDLSEFKLTRTDENLFKDHEQMLNLSQLAAAQDTIRLEIAERKEKLTTRMENKFYFERYNLDSMPLFDSINYAHKSFLAQFPEEEQDDLLGMAQKGARSIKQQIHFTNKTIEMKHRSIVRHRIEWHRKFTWSVACLLLFLIGAPFGAVIRKGGLGLPLVITVVLFIIYHIISISGEKMTEQGVLAPYQGMWLATIVFLPVGIFLTIKGNSDSPIFNVDTYFKLFKKIKNLILPGKKAT